MVSAGSQVQVYHSLCCSFLPPTHLPVLLSDGDVLAIKEHLIDELDYILVPTEGWNKLVSWYGLTEGQEPIARKVRWWPDLIEEWAAHCISEGGFIVM